ncbi:hypothetical protein ACFSBF_14380 [Sphingobacterium suaedae]|uniref:hypothetical protein n=1 Tax=Sphingobacterium suaedae TaxID=1686402 RepID=UPI00362896A4
MQYFVAQQRRLWQWMDILTVRFASFAQMPAWHALKNAMSMRNMVWIIVDNAPMLVGHVQKLVFLWSKFPNV